MFMLVLMLFYLPAVDLDNLFYSVERVRQKIGRAGAKGVARMLRQMDSDDDKQLTKDELKRGLEVMHLT